MKKLIGPFSQMITLRGLSTKGPIADDSLEIIEKGGILIDEEGRIVAVDAFDKFDQADCEVSTLTEPSVAIPGLIDAHTHICFGGNRAKDYALRVSGTSYQEIAAQGGGILDTVRQTRKASEDDLLEGMLGRLQKLLRQGVTSCEVKSGYGLSIDEELKMLRVIARASTMQPIDIIPTCLAAHTLPTEYRSSGEYLKAVAEKLLPIVKRENLANRVDIFIERGAFSQEESIAYLEEAKKQGFSLCVHGNQFSSGGAEAAAKVHASSVDHLEVMSQEECQMLREANVTAIVLPGASIGLGVPFAPARMMLDQGLSVAIASDWNPGSAPMGFLLMQAAALGASEKLTIAETFSGITFRAARALGLEDRGTLDSGMRADIAIFPCADYREILYNQGSLLPSKVIIKGEINSV